MISFFCSKCGLMLLVLAVSMSTTKPSIALPTVTSTVHWFLSSRVMLPAVFITLGASTKKVVFGARTDREGNAADPTTVSGSVNNLFSPFDQVLNGNTANIIADTFDEDNIQRIITVLQNNIKQWSFIESQLLEPNVNIGMPEIFIPLKHLTTTLEILGNILFVKNDLHEAKLSLERACPLMELLPADVLHSPIMGEKDSQVLMESSHENYLAMDYSQADSNGNAYSSGCFALLRDVYMKLYGPKVVLNNEISSIKRRDFSFKYKEDNKKARKKQRKVNTNISKENDGDGKMSAQRSIIRESRNHGDRLPQRNPEIDDSISMEEYPGQATADDERKEINNQFNETSSPSEFDDNKEDYTNSSVDDVDLLNLEYSAEKSQINLNGDGNGSESNVDDLEYFNVDERFDELRSPFDHLRVTIDDNIDSELLAIRSGNDKQDKKNSNTVDLDRHPTKYIPPHIMAAIRAGHKVQHIPSDQEENRLKIIYRLAVGLNGSSMENYFSESVFLQHIVNPLVEDKSQELSVDQQSIASMVAFDLENMLTRFIAEDALGRNDVLKVSRKYYDEIDINIPEMDYNEYAACMEFGNVFLEVMSKANEEGFDFIFSELDDWVRTYDKMVLKIKPQNTLLKPSDCMNGIDFIRGAVEEKACVDNRGHFIGMESDYYLDYISSSERNRIIALAAFELGLNVGTFKFDMTNKNIKHLKSSTFDAVDVHNVEKMKKVYPALYEQIMSVKKKADRKHGNKNDGKFMRNQNVFEDGTFNINQGQMKMQNLDDESAWSFHLFMVILLTTVVVVYLSHQESLKRRSRVRHRSQKKSQTLYEYVLSFFSTHDNGGQFTIEINFKGMVPKILSAFADLRVNLSFFWSQLLHAVKNGLQQNFKNTPNIVHSKKKSNPKGHKRGTPNSSSADLIMKSLEELSSSRYNGKNSNSKHVNSAMTSHIYKFPDEQNEDNELEDDILEKYLSDGDGDGEAETESEVKHVTEQEMSDTETVDVITKKDEEYVGTHSKSSESRTTVEERELSDEKDFTSSVSDKFPEVAAVESSNFKDFSMAQSTTAPASSLQNNKILKNKTKGGKASVSSVVILSHTTSVVSTKKQQSPSSVVPKLNDFDNVESTSNKTSPTAKTTSPRRKGQNTEVVQENSNDFSLMQSTVPKVEGLNDINYLSTKEESIELPLKPELRIIDPPLTSTPKQEVDLLKSNQSQNIVENLVQAHSQFPLSQNETTIPTILTEHHNNTLMRTRTETGDSMYLQSLLSESLQNESTRANINDVPQVLGLPPGINTAPSTDHNQFAYSIEETSYLGNYDSENIRNVNNEGNFNDLFGDLVGYLGDGKLKDGTSQNSNNGLGLGLNSSPFLDFSFGDGVAPSSITNEASLLHGLSPNAPSFEPSVYTSLESDSIVPNTSFSHLNSLYNIFNEDDHTSKADRGLSLLGQNNPKKIDEVATINTLDVSVVLTMFQKFVPPDDVCAIKVLYTMSNDQSSTEKEITMRRSMANPVIWRCALTVSVSEGQATRLSYRYIMKDKDFIDWKQDIHNPIHSVSLPIDKHSAKFGLQKEDFFEIGYRI